MFLKAKPDLANHQIILRRATVCFFGKEPAPNCKRVIRSLDSQEN